MQSSVLPRKPVAMVALDLVVGIHVDGRRGLVAHDDLAAAHQGTGQGHELALAEREVEAVLLDDGVEVQAQGVAGVRRRRRRGRRRAGGGGGGDLGPHQVGLAQGRPELQVGVLVEGVEVAAHGAAEQGRVLGMMARRERRSCRPTVEMSSPSRVMRPPLSLDQPEQRRHDGRLAGARAADDADALAAGDVHVEPAQHERQALAVAHLHVVEDDLALLGPRRPHLDSVQRGLLLERVAVVLAAARPRSCRFSHLGQLAHGELDHLHDAQDVRQHEPGEWTATR